MTSERRVLANRQNAAKSTGPKSDAGKARVAANARRHGLTGSTAGEGGLINEIAKELAKGLGLDAPALEIAQLQDLLLRIRSAKAKACEEALAEVTAKAAPGTAPEELDTLALILAAPDILKFDEYERKALSRRRRALRALED